MADFFMRPPTLTTGNFEAIWPKDLKFLAIKDLNCLNKYAKYQEASSILRVGFAISKWPHLYSAYLVTVCNRTFIAVPSIFVHSSLQITCIYVLGANCMNISSDLIWLLWICIANCIFYRTRTSQDMDVWLTLIFAKSGTTWDIITKISAFLQLMKKWILTKFGGCGSKIEPATPVSILNFSRTWQSIKVSYALHIWYKAGSHWV